jgi:hypothetical protein
MTEAASLLLAIDARRSKLQHQTFAAGKRIYRKKGIRD